MINFVVGFILGIAAATIGFNTVAEIADNGVEKVQEIVKELANK